MSTNWGKCLNKQLDNKAARQLARLLSMHALRDAEAFLAGAYHSRFKGDGLDFAELTDYEEGMDARFIQWPLSMAHGRTLVKRFEEERQMPLLLAVDVSSSMWMFKSSFDTALSAVSLLAASAVLNGDSVGMVLGAEDYVENTAQRGELGQVFRIVYSMMECRPGRRGTMLSSLLGRVGGMSRRGSRIVLVSDLLDDGYARVLRSLSVRHEVMVCHAVHRLDKSLSGGVELEDAETGGRACLLGEQKQDYSRRIVEESGAEYVPIPCGESALQPLLNYFKRRKSG